MEDSLQPSSANYINIVQKRFALPAPSAVQIKRFDEQEMLIFFKTAKELNQFQLCNLQKLMFYLLGH